MYKRPLYKRPRPPARKFGEIRNFAPLVGLENAHPTEIGMALTSVGRSRKDANGNPVPVVFGRALGYDPIRNIYSCTGKALNTGKAQDFTVEGEVVAYLIAMARDIQGGIFDKQGLTKRGGGLLPGLPG